jgi:hypothetical protein
MPEVILSENLIVAPLKAVAGATLTLKVVGLSTLVTTVPTVNAPVPAVTIILLPDFTVEVSSTVIVFDKELALVKVVE